ncbi:hypothetical protein FIU83_09165 [Halomonas sp. THAF5a]|uniref:hypothetical protein n=1 Tax=Halomonas sp. THAF5a TaxID=2587844 RepID=UPI001268FBF7|nr:hypothetical protein [Halomonas sp. THAF5a]QFU01808.1 hypothetical protein FIU83_09165 [Halomonas sp. THAF5a]
MTTLIVFHEVEDGEHWARAWQQGPGSRHEMFARIGVSARTFKNPEHPNSVGLILEVPDMERFQAFMASDEARQAMEEDRLRVDTLRMLGEFTP